MVCDFTKLKEKLLYFDLNITKQMEEQFSIYYHVLIDWNKVMNLTAITEFDEIVEKHFLDSIALGHYMNLEHKLELIDIGTGAGFPGIPLKIVFPQLNVTLVDSLNKRINFLKEVIEQLELKNVSAVHGRAEELAREKRYREQFDLCVTRAVANLSSLSEYCIPFVKSGGVFVAYKSYDIESEVEQARNAFSLLGGKLDDVKKFQLPETEYQRSFVFVHKVKSTSKKYPRKAGTPTKQPL